MLRNIEIKAKVRNLDDIVSKAEKLTNSEGTWIKQDDVFFRVPQGRLKLRTFEVSCRNTIQVCNFFLSEGDRFLENVTMDKLI
jgi:adenylate cyclase class IV